MADAGGPAATPDVYHRTTVLYASKEYVVHFAYVLTPPSIIALELDPEAESHKWLYAIIADEQGPMFAVRKGTRRHPKERRDPQPLPHRHENDMLTGIKQRLSQGRWQRGKVYHYDSPDDVSLDDLIGNLCAKLNVTTEELYELVEDVSLTPGATRRGRTRDDIALAFGLPHTEPLGKQLAQRRVLTWQEANYLDAAVADRPGTTYRII